MTISVQASKFKSANYGSSISMSLAANGTIAAGDLLIAVVACYRLPLSWSTGWTEFITSGTTGNYLRALWRIADLSSADTLTGSWGLGGQICGVLGVYRSTLGFDSSSIVSNSSNCAGATSGTTYALATGLTGVTAGQLSVCLGGFADSTTRNVTLGTSGTSWTNDYADASPPSVFGYAAAASNTVTGSPAVPSITFNNSFSNIKFIAAMVLKENAAAGLPGGLFFGMA